jgi:hypothetical protein
MTILNIKEKDLSIIIPYKNGHTLLYTTFIHLFKHLNIEVGTNPDEILSNVYVFVRNPINRFFSSYNWLDYMSKIGEDEYKKNIKILLKKINVCDIDSYISQYGNFLIECDDFHYIPQSCQILCNKNKIYKNELIDIKTDLKLLYDAKFGLNYKIFKIENIDEIIEKNIFSLIEKNVGFNKQSESVAFNINKFDFLEDYPNDVSFLFSTFYQYFKNIFKMTHHHKNIDYTNKINLPQYKLVCSITENERIFFGYNLEEIDYKVFKKTLI